VGLSGAKARLPVKPESETGPHSNGSSFKVDVGPPKPENFAQSHSGRQGHIEKRLKLISLGCIQICTRVVEIQPVRLVLVCAWPFDEGNRIVRDDASLSGHLEIFVQGAMQMPSGRAAQSSGCDVQNLDNVLMSDIVQLLRADMWQDMETQHGFISGNG
jgi:hypothetical protein